MTGEKALCFGASDGRVSFLGFNVLQVFRSTLLGVVLRTRAEHASLQLMSSLRGRTAQDVSHTARHLLRDVSESVGAPQRAFGGDSIRWRLQSLDQDCPACPDFLSTLSRLHTHKLRAVILPDPCRWRDYSDRGIFSVFRSPRPLPRVLNFGGFEVMRLGLQNGGSRG